MNYIEYNFTITPTNPGNDILIAELAEKGFESFVEQENGIDAYIQKEDWNPDILDDLFILKNPEFTIDYHNQEIEQVNWNEEWEKNFNPIVVNNKVSVRAPFHEKPNLPYDIVIEPKMSFGTGHHETTHLMIEQLLDLDLTEKKVLDMGCGTGILAIFSEMKGATKIDAIDIDEWCYENTVENLERNNCSHISVSQGDASLLTDQQYDVIIANINRNILLQDIRSYNKCLNNGGLLLLSGFYTEDVSIINEEATKLNLQLQKTLERNNWVALSFTK